jgi:hypothetical protein
LKEGKKTLGAVEDEMEAIVSKWKFAKRQVVLRRTHGKTASGQLKYAALNTITQGRSRDSI